MNYAQSTLDPLKNNFKYEYPTWKVKPCHSESKSMTNYFGAPEKKSSIFVIGFLFAMEFSAGCN